ncbi:cytochrome P450 [Nocardiopsis ansamitocini]|uniref:Methyl-branched lipid omega-hydroxylase n=1 Tax=Nocardiopsis ansamitocini TaxID=1670832 RepID=A0A9W6P6G2_9ACTN|nr:cytochrome P450 [Nocardiopsis ansamitocini]GLU48011.1 methyl-branched lipid omega-hydroxylase [Nocardiopsis ansamitocini]
MPHVPQMSRPADVSDIDLSDLAFWERPLKERHKAFARLRRYDPLFFAEADMGPVPIGPGYHALVRHADVVEASRTPLVFTSEPSAISIPDMPREFSEFFGSMINLDDPRHARMRRIVSRGFTPRMLAKLDADIQRVAARIIDDLLDTGPCDFVPAVSARLPLTIICEMMGIPEEQHRRVFDNSSIVLAGSDPDYLGNDPETAVHRLLAAGGELAALLTELAAERRRAPRQDLTSALVSADIDGDALTDQEIGSFFILLAVAGNETTRNAISHALALLTRFPDQRDTWWSDFEAHAATAVEEIVRYASPITWMRRTLSRDHEMNGTHYRAGDKVLLMYASANRDSAVFTDPDRFDVTRSPNPHVGFGGPGPHFCLGAHLARREITVMLREMHRRVPTIRATSEPQRLLSNFVNGIKSLPCDF